ncbi:uncharacterized protein BKCO1_3100065 [Diplodia corticola]|uniref:Uncharacterized protein n=1 Tax=Diplodia corticola TaxID=236234 RepID=A0A1J9RL57_9PEZI|nr:uncharacterized protein BKCO1_3100065 [Diplodia corticola]OJD33315.1 hypothetical protein BKCO1_3100065 [Diplodia corticola]
MSDQSTCRRNTDARRQALHLPAGLWGPSPSSSTTAVSQGPSPSTAANDASSTAAQRFPGLRQLYSGAASWRASLRGRPKSTTTETSVSSRPVIVRTYSGGSSSRPRRPSSHMPQRPVTLPPAADFSFDGILHAVEPEISGAIDAIAAICARSKLSLADEYAAHRPPHEVLDPAIPLELQQRQRWWSVVRDTALSAVPEASSSSERLVGSRTASRASVSSAAGHSSRGKKNSAYGSLKSIVSGDSNARKGLSALFGSNDGRADADDYHDPPSPSGFNHTAHWMVSDSTRPSITLSSGPAARAASPRVSLATSEEPMGTGASSSLNGGATTHHHPPRPRPVALSTWLPSHPTDRGPQPALHDPSAGTAAEKSLKDLLRTTSSSGEGRKPIGATE